MPKTSRKLKPIIEKSILATKPWSCTNFGEQSEIDAYVDATGTWETIATIQPVAAIDAEDIASFITNTINTYEKTQRLIQKMRAALELALECEGLSEETTQYIEAILEETK
ncbi:MAG TPA: hypothetical protein VMV79_01285 [Alphaproteobacteria bacterium]|nr:hypothetical protein [Alphaproteobacteria bacterium]